MYLRITAACLLAALSVLADAQTDTQVNRTDEKGKKQGPWIRKYPNGNIQYEGYFRDDHPVGEFKRYLEDNTLWALLVYSDDGREALATMFHPNGYVASRGKYVDQKKEGKWYFFSYRIENYRFNEEEYSANLKNGISIKYYPDSTIAEKISYLNDVKHGEWVLYRESGALMLRTSYVNGRLDGRYEAFFENGNPEFTGEYKNDLKEGLWHIYKEDGSVRFRIDYFAGTPKNRDLDIYETEYIDAVEAKYKGKIPDPERTGNVW